MIGAFAAAVMFLIVAYAADYVTIEWHKSRESRKKARTAFLSGILEAISWSPILVAISTENSTAWLCAITSIMGSYIGTWHGMVKLEKDAGRSRTSEDSKPSQ